MDDCFSVNQTCPGLQVFNCRLALVSNWWDLTHSLLIWRDLTRSSACLLICLKHTKQDCTVAIASTDSTQNTNHQPVGPGASATRHRTIIQTIIAISLQITEHINWSNQLHKLLHKNNYIYILSMI